MFEEVGSSRSILQGRRSFGRDDYKRSIGRSDRY